MQSISETGLENIEAIGKYIARTIYIYIPFLYKYQILTLLIIAYEKR